MLRTKIPREEKEGKKIKIGVIIKKSEISFIHPKDERRMMSSEYSTEEEQNERRGKVLESEPLPLWRLFREASLSGGACRDIVEKHVMWKLNGTDLKFLHEVNSETRKLIKRSSRAGDLKKKFKVREMSSISTLEFVWENKSLWRRSWDETYFCWKLLKRINSSCSSGHERRKSVSGMKDD